MHSNGRESNNVPESYLTFLEKQALEDSERWFGDQPRSQSLVHHVLSLCGEAGELANLVKKIERGSLDPKDPKVIMQLRMETGDVFVYLLNIAALLAFDLDAMNNYLRQKNEERFMEQRREREARAKS